ncbi:MAG: hypothetical protein IT164_07760, partial [Bryobacterales bacterium]|nr:hypothetical protein [Bryobacterales bacterium]
RLEIGGVMKSWAVPMGPPVTPGEKRLAILTEDHALEFALFQGNIPKGEYGAGRISIWDIGSYEPEGLLSPKEQFDRGEISFRLLGERLRGRFALRRPRAASWQLPGKDKWLLTREP